MITLRLVGEIGRRVDEAGQLDDLAEPVEIAATGGAHLGDEGERAGPGGFAAAGDVDVPAELAR